MLCCVQNILVYYKNTHWIVDPKENINILVAILKIIYKQSPNFLVIKQFAMYGEIQILSLIC